MESFRKMLTEDGVGILSYRIELPDLGEDDGGARDPEAFYRGIAERVMTYLETVVAERLRTEYRESDDARKRFTFRPMVYCMTARRDGESCILRRVTLSRGGRLLYENETADLLSDGRVLPYASKMKKTERKARKIRESACNKDENVV